jgi:type IV pilus assembly protein PilX
MAATRHRIGRAQRPQAGRQRGVVMIITLVALAVLLVGAAAMLRSSDTSTALAGQLGFRRDMKNQAERAISMAVLSLKNGDLATSAARQSNLASANYSAAQLDTDAATGIPTILLKSDADFEEANYTINIVDADSSSANATSGIKARYVIDRMCLAAGVESSASCSRTSVKVQTNGQDSNAQKGSTPFRSTSLVVYRISVRVDGPRGTQAFFQSTVAR